MKKIFFSFLAIAAIASCAKTEAVFTEGNSEIKIKPATTIATKAAHLGVIDGTTYPVAENFDVYGYWADDWTGVTEPTAYLITTEGGAEFENKGNYWGGITPYHWPKDGSLKFAAYSPASENFAHDYATDTYSKVGYVQPSNTAATWDLLFAKTTEPYTAMTAAENVSVVFEHALAWITLQVKAQDATAAQAFEIKKVTINDVYTQADAAIAMPDGIQANEWTGHADAQPYVVYAGSQAVNQEVAVIENTTAGTIVIPQETTTVTIEYTQKQLAGTVALENQKITLPLTLDANQTVWEPGKHYTYTLVFGLEEILINPSVVDWVDQDPVVGSADPNVHNVYTAEQLQAALNEGGKVIFQANIAGVFNVTEFAETVVIDGNGYELNGAFNIVGGSAYKNGTTVIKNLDFVASDASQLANGDTFVYCADQNGGNRYPDNVSIENCTFTAEGAVVEKAVAAKFRSLEGVVAMDNVKADALHSVLQMLSSGNAFVKVSGVEAVNCKNGISLETVTGTIQNSTIESAEYGIRANGSNATLKVVKTTIKSEKPIIVRKLTNAAHTYNVALEEAVLEAGQTYAVVFTNGADDAEFVAPAGKFTITGAAGYNVFPSSAVATGDELKAALSNNSETDTVVLEDDVDISDTAAPYLHIGKEVTITTNNYELEVGNPTNYGVFCNAGSDVTFNDAEIVSNGGAVVVRDGAKAVFNSGSITIESTQTSQRYCFYAFGAGTEVTINGGTFGFDAYRKRAYAYVADNAKLYITGGTFGPASNHPTDPTAPFTADSGAEVVITGGTFGFNPSAWVPATHEAVQNGTTWTVSAK